MKTRQAYKFALDPTCAQERAMWSHAGGARFAWNWGLAKCKERYEAEGKWYSAIDLHKLWNAEKKADPALAWWSENSKCVYQEAFRDLGQGLRNFVSWKKGESKKKQVGFPRFKKRGKCRDSFRFGGGTIGCDGAATILPRIGTVKTHEDTSKLARKITDGSARIISATVTRTAQRWFVAFTVEVERDAPLQHARAGSAVGVDLGIKALVTGFDDTGGILRIVGPSPLRSSLRKLRRAGRAHSRKRPGSANSRKAAARLARMHARLANVRVDALHKATSDLSHRYETVIIESLNVRGMISNRKLSRAVSDQGFTTVRRMLEYKTEREGGRLVIVDRWYPSSKTCSECGSVKAKLTMKERTFVCANCDFIEDRDVNAARNLLKLAASGAESQNARGGTVSPHIVRLIPVKQEPGTAHAGETGTVPAQAGAAA